MQKINSKLDFYIYKGAETFEIRKNGDWYSLFDINSGKAVDVEGAKALNETNVSIYDYHGGTAQKWRFEDAGNGYVYIRFAGGTYMDVASAKTDDGTNLWTYSFNGSAAQVFKLIPISEIPDITPSPIPVTELPTFNLTQHEGYTEITNNSDFSYTPAIIIAEYENGILINVSILNTQFEAGEKRTIVTNGKVFVWNGLKSMIPLTK